MNSSADTQARGHSGTMYLLKQARPATTATSWETGTEPWSGSWESVAEAWGLGWYLGTRS